MNSHLHRLTSFVRFNEQAFNSDGYASDGYAAYIESAAAAGQPGATPALEHALEQYCPLTVGALRLVGAWAADLSDFAMLVRRLGLVGDNGARFMVEMAGHMHPLVASVAQFEAAIKKVREGHTEDHVIGWSYSPNLVLASLREGERLDLEAARGRYWTVVAHDLPGHYHVLAASEQPDGESSRPRENREERR
ncbi:MAG TPA: hypothetical protein VFO71_03875, partial [Gemmatimonadales bacterium]|nr:hypothetical protein [Gemmatimonadales bacterium]